jgi:putative transposase
VSDQTSGGRSSATPEEGARDTATSGARGSSPLHAGAKGPRRKRPAHFPTVESGFRSVIVFLTVCTRQRRSLLANDQGARLIIDAWQAADFWCVGRYVIMPNHIHLFCAPNTFPAQPLKNWMAFWRNRVTRAWPSRDQIPIWQREYWDRQLRRGESYAQKWAYVENNPVRHGHVARARDWPYQGELNTLSWHD